MIVCLTALGSLLASFQQPPSEPESARELYWESTVLRRFVSDVQHNDPARTDAATAKELLWLAADVADAIVALHTRLQHPPTLPRPQHSSGWRVVRLGGGGAAASRMPVQAVQPGEQAAAGDDAALQALSITAAAAAETAQGLLGFLTFPSLQDASIAQRLAASSVIGLGFGLPPAALTRGLTGAREVAAVAGTARRAVELLAAAPTVDRHTGCLEPVVCRPGVLHAFLRHAAEALAGAGAAPADAGWRNFGGQVREHVAAVVHWLLSGGQPAFQGEAQRVLGDAPLLGRLLRETAEAWHARAAVAAAAGEHRTRIQGVVHRTWPSSPVTGDAAEEPRTPNSGGSAGSLRDAANLLGGRTAGVRQQAGSK